MGPISGLSQQGSYICPAPYWVSEWMYLFVSKLNNTGQHYDVGRTSEKVKPSLTDAQNNKNITQTKTQRYNSQTDFTADFQQVYMG